MVHVDAKLMYVCGSVGWEEGVDLVCVVICFLFARVPGACCIAMHFMQAVR